MSKENFHSNPIIKNIYTADPAPMVYGDTLYLYTTHDEDNLINDFYTMKDGDVFLQKIWSTGLTMEKSFLLKIFPGLMTGPGLLRQLKEMENFTFTARFTKKTVVWQLP